MFEIAYTNTLSGRKVVETATDIGTAAAIFCHQANIGARGIRDVLSKVEQHNYMTAYQTFKPFKPVTIRKIDLSRVPTLQAA